MYAVVKSHLVIVIILMCIIMAKDIVVQYQKHITYFQERIILCIYNKHVSVISNTVVAFFVNSYPG